MTYLYNSNTLEEIVQRVYDYFSDEDNVLKVVTKLNRNGKIKEFLEDIECTYFMEPEVSYSTYKNGKIVVVGKSSISEDKLLGIAKSLGIDKNRFEMHLDYDDAKTFKYSKMQWQPKYSLVIVGPQGHSSIDKGKYSSAIARMEQEEGFPPVLRSGTNNELSIINKSSFKANLKRAIEKGWIEVN